jgi:hypothetical protein
LDEIIKDLLHECDEAIANHSTPLQKDEADGVEKTLFDELTAKYDRKAEKKCKRASSGDRDDNIEVKKRSFQRSLNARSGKIYAKFSGEIQSLNNAAEGTLRRAVETLAELEQSLLVDSS